MVREMSNIMGLITKDDNGNINEYEFDDFYDFVKKMNKGNNVPKMTDMVQVFTNDEYIHTLEDLQRVRLTRVMDIYATVKQVLRIVNEKNFGE